MRTPELNYFVIIVLFATHETKGNVSSPAPGFSSSPLMPISTVKSSTSVTQIEQNAHIYPSITIPAEAHPTLESDLSPELPSSSFSPEPYNMGPSQMPQFRESANSEVSRVSEETNSINEILTGNDELFNINQITISPELGNIVQDLPSAKSTPSVNDESRVNVNDRTEIDLIIDGTASSGITTKKGRLGPEPWKIGLISAAVFLAVEVLVLTVYCFVCRKRRSAFVVKNCEQDSEAGETINVESNDNTITGEEGTLNCTHVVDGSNNAVQEEGQKKCELKSKTMDNKSTDV
ncbi:uncharacterized protein LOC128474275 [Spea bombifrons]|uniref:uncharacterized protein LOC128474275 n=1 Tax=Spea bombifrons TaxID=233779 RepID=UPI002349CB80|nr:uncharacterized protein LOC128474275 [Spea bombifrons]